MPTFTIKDPGTGRTIHMTGAKPPSESDIKAAFAAAPPQQKQLQGNSGGVVGAIQAGSDALRGVGLGGLPDIGMAVTGALQGGVGKENPFITQQEFAQRKQQNQQDPLSGVKQGVQDAAGIVGNLNPLTGGEGLLARAGVGGASAGLQAMAQPGATPGSVGTDSVVGGSLNALAPGLGNLVKSSVGRVAFGKSGAMFKDLVQAAGQPITGGLRKQVTQAGAAAKPTLQDNLWNKTKILDTQFKNLLTQSGSKLSRADIFGKVNPSGQLDGGLVSQALSRIGPSNETEAKSYLDKMESSLTTMYQDHLVKNGMNSTKALQVAQNPNTPIPHEILQQFLSKVRNDISPNSWIQKMIGNTVNDPTDRVATDFSSQLRKQIAGSSANPAEYERLQLLRKARGDISSHLSKKAGGASSVNFLTHLAEAGIPLEIAGGLLHLAGPASAGALLGTAMAQPGIASKAISGMSSKGAGVTSQALQRLLTGGLGGAMANPQMQQ